LIDFPQGIISIQSSNALRPNGFSLNTGSYVSNQQKIFLQNQIGFENMTLSFFFGTAQQQCTVFGVCTVNTCNRLYNNNALNFEVGGNYVPFSPNQSPILGNGLNHLAIVFERSLSSRFYLNGVLYTVSDSAERNENFDVGTKIFMVTLSFYFLEWSKCKIS
jgi:hypothetical protein